MKKIGVALYSDFGGSLETFLSFLQKLNVNYVEIGKEWIPKKGDTRKTKDLLDIYDLKANLHISQHYNLAELNYHKWKRNILGVLGDLGICYDLKIENAVLHCGWIKREDINSFSIDDGMERFADAYNIINDYAKDFCVKIGLENQCTDGYKYYLFQDTDNVNKIESLIGEDISYVLDVGHLGRLGQPINQMIDRIEDKLIGIHLHDYNDFGIDHLPIGTGNLQVNELFSLLKGKDIFITLENRSVPHIKYSLIHSPLTVLCHPACRA
jgi:sugar phosphate isomerase/epimerase